MRKIDPTYGAMPNEINYTNIEIHLNLVLQDLANGANGNIYRATVNGENKTSIALREKYNNKCGYCESIEFSPVVEHHRPVGQVNNNGEVGNGYNWLAYEWSNMVASCDRCNERPYKGTQFPTNRNRILSPIFLLNQNPDFESFRYNGEYLQSEDPLLLHPEYIDAPENHFEFNCTGEIVGLTDKGRTSITVYGLDDDTHNVNRRAIYDNYFNQVERVVRKRVRAENPISEAQFVDDIAEVWIEILERHLNQELHPFTLFTHNMIIRFEHFFVEPFDPIIHPLLRRTYITILETLTNNPR